ncbi:DMT family transporter [Paragemmobacter straminiformis]|uniref:DMT family transporter n=1 Tax=Paragemmobacter straminiformis TaxID=2045119 RepID=A0A842HYH7_9RHOB|nr:DMT family transporter [Gemmobacter straminiformis]MBC2833882.1 DMT family transporter [Gemmobacter straminiformis]
MARVDWLRLGLLSLLWGGSFFFVEIALAGLPPLAIVWLRVVMGALGLAGVIRVSGQGLPRGRAVWAALAGMGVLNNAIPFTLFALAQGQISGGLAAILNATTPLFTLVALHLFTTDDRITPARLFGLVAGLAGVAVMMWGRGLDGTLWAKIACLGAACSYGVAGVWARRFKRLGVGPMQVAFGQCASAAVVVLPVMLAFAVPFPLPEAKVWAAMAGLGLLSTVLAYVLFFGILASAGAMRLSLVTFLIPVSATGLGIAFLGQMPEPRHLAGFALIALGLVAVGRKPRAASRGNWR